MMGTICTNQDSMKKNTLSGGKRDPGAVAKGAPRRKALEAFDDLILEGMQSPMTRPFTEEDVEQVVKDAEAYARHYRMRTI